MKENIIKLNTVEYRKLVDEAIELRKTIDSNKELIANLRADIRKEREAVEELKNKANNKEQGYIKEFVDPYDGRKTRTIIGFKELKSEIEESIKSDAVKELRKLKDKNMVLKRAYDDINLTLEDISKRHRKEIQRAKDSISEDYEEQLETMFKRHRKTLERKNDEISTLKEEIEKVRNDKTDELLAKQRKEEIDKLTKHIEELEAELAHAHKLGFFGRLFDRISNYYTRKHMLKDKANRVKELEELKAADKHREIQAEMNRIYSLATSWATI